VEIKETIGIDVGKLKNEVRIHRNQKTKEFENTDKGIFAFYKINLVTKRKGITLEIFIHIDKSVRIRPR
jgi:hypothetical protein